MSRHPWVYAMQSVEFIKIGAANHVGTRRKQFQLGNPHELKVVLRHQIEEAYWVEKRLHKLLDHQAIGREWFKTTLPEIRAALKVVLEELATRRRELVAAEIADGGEVTELVASWNGRGICRPDALSIWGH